ncbi:glycosyltransferase [Castellaniella sp.]|uniref:glycosyltransferase n=1 Tax=Castellaniella sp. TaxID=1955812 RepID=UPI002AFFAF9E|nr:glycosyltransferase [Castellaniella sp.]
MNNIHITLTEFRNESRVIKETTSLVSLGLFNKVRVVALGADDLPERETVAAGVDVVRIRLRTRHLPRNILFQAVKFVEFFIRAMLQAYLFRPGVINVHTLALLPVGWSVKMLCGSKLVYDAHELETEVVWLRGVKQRVAKGIERCFIGSCSLVIVVSESIADWYQKEYSIKRPFVVMNSPRRIVPESSNKLRRELNISDNQLIFLYQGGLTRGRGVKALMDAFKVRMDNNAVIVFMGYGELLADVVDASQQCERIFYRQAVPPRELLGWTSSADVGVSLIEPSCLSYLYCMPNKLFEYAMAGLPVMVSQTKDMADFVRKWNIGVVLSDMTPAGINLSVDQMVSNVKFREGGERAYKAALCHSWEVQEVHLLEGYASMGVYPV